MKRRFQKSYSEESPIFSGLGLLPAVFFLFVLFGFVSTEKGKPPFGKKLSVTLPEGDFQEHFSGEEPVIYFSVEKSSFSGGCGRPTIFSINDKIYGLRDIPDILSQEPYYSGFYEKIRAVIRADRKTDMGNIYDLKSTLQLYNHVELLYATYPHRTSKKVYWDNLFREDPILPPPRTAQPPIDKTNIYPNFFKKKEK